MKANTRLSVLAVLTIAVLLLSACAPASAPLTTSGGKVQPATVEFTGVITSVNGNQFTVSGQTVSVDPQAATQFKAGDTVHIKGQVAANGIVTAASVTSPASPSTADSSNSNDSNSNDSNSNDSNSNSSGDNSNSGGSNTNDDNSNSQSGEDQKITGTVEAINGNQITISGVTYTVADGVDLSGIAVGDTVTIEVINNADGTQSVTEVKSGSDDGVNSNDDNGNDSSDDDSNTNDDNSNSDDTSGGNGNSNDGGGNSGSGGNGNGGGGGGNGNGG
jgi:uncharacterized membrane protein YgcG